MPSKHFILCHPLILLPSIFPNIRVFANELALCIRWPKFWSFSFNNSPSNEHSGLISLRMNGLDLPAVQGTLKSLLQNHNSKASILQCSAFSTVQLSHPYMTTGKTRALTRHTFVGKIMSLLFNMLSNRELPDVQAGFRKGRGTRDQIANTRWIIEKAREFQLLLLLLLLLSRFSRVRLRATPEMEAHQAPPSLGFSRQEHWRGLPFPSPMQESEKWKWSRSVVSNSSRPHELQSTRLLHPWDFPGKSTGVGCHRLLRYIHTTMCKTDD